MLRTRGQAPVTPFRVGRMAGLSAALAGLAMSLSPAMAADDLIVRYDQSQLLRMPRVISEIIIGNPSIADVSIQGGNMLVITGKTFGITNIIALDADKNIIQDQRIVVERDERGVVNVSRAGLRQSFSCTPNCAPTLTIGDEATFFDQVVRHSATKTKFSETGSEGSSGGQGNQ